MIGSKPQRTLLAVLLVVLMAVLARALHSTTSAALADANLQGSSEATAAAVMSRDAQRQYAKSLAWGRDPFAPGSRGGGPGAVSALALSGILWDPTAPIAVINGAMLRVGDQFEGYRVVAISRDAVSLSGGGKTFQLQLSQ